MQEVVPSKQKVRAACPKDKLEFKFFSSPVFYWHFFQFSELTLFFLYFFDFVSTMLGKRFQNKFRVKQNKVRL